MTFIESGLEFHFNGEWNVQKYDAHRYYQGLSGAGLKAVDFIGILRDRKVVFLEVKNYRIRFSALSEPPIQPILNDPGLLAGAVARKVEHSLLAIDAIRQAFQRRWSYRLFFPFIRNWPRLNTDWTFWSRVYDLVQDSQNIQVALWMETEEPLPQVRRQLHTYLSKGVDEITAKVAVIRHDDHPFGPSLQTRPVIAH